MPINMNDVINRLEARQRKMQEEQNLLLKKNKEAQQEADLSGAALKTKYDKKIQHDMESIVQFNRILGPLQTKEGEFPIKTNKIKLILDGIDSLPLSKDGDIVVNYNNTISASYTLPSLGSNEFWGSSLSTYYTTSLLYRLSAITDTKVSEILPLNSSVYHIAPLTQSILNLLAEQSVIEESYIFQQGKYLGFGFPHGAYAFGGSRGQAKFYPKIFSETLHYEPLISISASINKFFAEDCSSWIMGDEVFQQKHIPSTADFLCAYRTLTNSTDFVPKSWSNESGAQELLQNFIPVDPVMERVQPGDMYFYRSSATTSDLGKSGHVGLVYAWEEQNKFQSIEFTRDMPEKKEGASTIDFTNGFGIEGFGIREREHKEGVFYLRCRI